MTETKATSALSDERVQELRRFIASLNWCIVEEDLADMEILFVELIDRRASGQVEVTHWAYEWKFRDSSSEWQQTVVEGAVDPTIDRPKEVVPGKLHPDVMIRNLKPLCAALNTRSGEVGENE